MSALRLEKTVARDSLNVWRDEKAGHFVLREVCGFELRVVAGQESMRYRAPETDET
jgi:hypothetical protein